MRLAKQLEKKISKAADEDDAAQLKADLHIAQVDIDYAIYFPFMEVYVSLYAAAAAGEKKDEETNTAAQYLRTPRPPMWAVVEKTREEGQAALERLQNRRAETPSSTTEARPARPARQPAERKAPAAKPDSTSRSFDAPAEKPDSSSRGMNRRERRKEARASQSRRGKADEKEEAEESDGGGFFE